MTCVVAVATGRKVLLGADSLIATESEVWPAGLPKIWVAGGGKYGIGFAGELEWGDFLRYHVHWPAKTDNLPRRLTACVKRAVKRTGIDLKKLDGSAIICHAGQIYSMDSFLTVVPDTRGYLAIGQSDLAHGVLFATNKLALTPKRRVRLALEAAAEHSKDVRKPWVWLKV